MKRKSTLSLGSSKRKRTAQLTLLDLPGAWLHNLLREGHLEGVSKKALAQTCAFLRDLALETHAGTTRMRIDLSAPKTAYQAVASANWQHAVLRSCSKVALEITSSSSGMLHPTGVTAGMSSISTTLHLQCSMRQSLLMNVTAVKLQVHSMQQMFPACILDHCPNMQRLEIHVETCTFSAALPSPNLPTHTALQSLHIDYGNALEVSNSQDMTWAAAVELQHVLQHCPALTSLEVAAAHWPVDDECLWEAISAVASQLTSFAFRPQVEHLRWAATDLATGNPAFLTRFSQLQTLSLPNVVVDDTIMRTLASMCNLRQLMVRAFHLQLDCSGISCTWQRVHVLHDMHIASFALLPLKSIQALYLGHGEFFEVGISRLASGLPGIAAATQAVARTGRVHVVTAALRLCVWEAVNGQGTEALCAAALPLLNHFKGNVSTVHLLSQATTMGTFSLLAKHLPSSVKNLAVHCDGVQGQSTASLMAVLPPSVTQLLIWPWFHALPDMASVQAMWETVQVLCCSVSHAITMHLYLPQHCYDWVPDWHSRVLEGMACHGHLHVTVCPHVLEG